jgi:ribonucleoside-triphosphate reductase (formate)
MDNRTFDAPLPPAPPGEDAVAAPATENTPLVRRSDESVARFDSRRIVESLVKEAGVHPDLAHVISEEIQLIVQKSGFARLTSSLLRSLVDAKLVEHGLEKEYLAYSRLGVPLYDVDRIVHQRRARVSPAPLTPEGTSVLLAEAIKREYAILSVFSPPVANAHLIGDIFIQDLGAVDRPYSITQSLDGVKRHGFTLPNRFAASRPARHPEVLVAHLVKSSSALQGYFNGPVEWDSVNYGLAPFVEGLSSRNLGQIAQSLIFELSATSVTRGGQSSACTLHLDWDAPPYLADRPAIGPGGEPTGKTYGEYASSARALLRAMFEAYRDGDGQKLPFAGARPVLHVTPQNVESDKFRPALEETCQTVIERGGVWFAFDRDPTASFTQRYGLPLEGSWETAGGHEWRAAAFQAVAVNLPRAAHRAGAANVAGIFEELTRLMDIAAQAHLEKRVFLEKLLALGENGPLALLTLRRDNAAFLRLSRTTHRICPVGLNELAWCVTGHQLHESRVAREFGARVIACLATEAARLSSRHKTRFVLAESHAEGMTHRLAQMDLRFFPEDAAERMPGDPTRGDAYYSNGFKLAAHAAIAPEERIIQEGELQNGALLNATSDLFFGERLPAATELAALVVASCRHSHATGLLLSPEFTLCFDCHHVGHGLKSNCEACGSTNVDGLAQATNRYSHTSSWSRSMLDELRRRFRQNFSA